MNFSKIIRIFHFLPFLIFALIAISSTSWAATYYVDGSCASSGNGTTAVCGVNGPWKTLAQAVTGMPNNANHTINVAAGTYPETLTDTRSGVNPGYRYWKANGTVNIIAINISGNYVKVEGFTMDGTPYVANTGTIHITGSNWYIKGCTVTDSHRHSGFRVWNANSDGGIFENNVLAGIDGTGLFITGTNHQILNNDISDMRTAGVSAPGDGDFIRPFGSGHVFRGNYIHNLISSHLTPLHVDAFQTWSATSPQLALRDSIIERNHIFMGEDATGLLLEAWDAANTISAFMIEGNSSNYANNITIKNNLIESWKGFEIGGGGWNVSNIKIYNNTWRSSLAFRAAYFPMGIHLVGVTTAEVYNNITVDYHVHYAIRGSSGISYDYNLMWNSDGTTAALEGYTPAANDKQSVQGGTIYDPKFVANYSDLHIQSDSPAKDAGVTIASVTNDYAGTSRPQGSAYDIGAYEYSGTTNLSPPTGLRIVN